ncbi:putative repeat protein (TIGR03943 family) [Microbacterium sp. SLBN-154]|uniref:TIGR03943 family putative permease subunit n=1 Tax=Microbacterium sp. SLBN-154 TaxID=2768458 RepID=UPI00116CEAC7|nr:putative repeat protein (TIGR03943 family) [Microbacterium sp. SLBN-154]
MPERSALLTRWLGVGLAAIMAVVTVSLALTGRLGLYINPESSWFAVSMSVLVLIGAVLSFLLPVGAEDDHGHDHGDGHGDGHGADAHAHQHGHAHGHATDPEIRSSPDHGAPLATRVATRAQARAAASRPRPARASRGSRRRTLGVIATGTGAVLATAVVLLTLVLPPRSLSAELAISRDVGAPPLFGGTDVVTLARTGDTASFGVGEWSAVFATATNPEAFDGDPVTLTGFVTPGDGGGFALSRLVITHCVIDAQSASIPVAVGENEASADAETGQWVTVDGMVRANSDGRLFIDAATVELIDEPEDPYEY